LVSRAATGYIGDMNHRYALIIAGGSGTRLWPMSRAKAPKQLIPFIQTAEPAKTGQAAQTDHSGARSLLRIALDRLTGLLPAERCFICAGRTHRDAVLNGLPGFAAERFLGEPHGRDTLNAVGLGAAIIALRDPGAVIAVFTADHVIEPVDRFQQIVSRGFAVAEEPPDSAPTLVTFGITPTHPATGYGYLELGEALPGRDEKSSFPPRLVRRFKEKPDAAKAGQYLAAGPEHYLWNSGMFVWRASTLLDCIARYQPAARAGLARIAAAWDTPQREKVLDEVYPTLPKISVDYAVMEPASRDAQVRVAAVPMPLSWLDVGSWPSFAQTCPRDEAGNALAAGRVLLLDSRGNLVASSDPTHLVAAIGCEGLLIVHTPEATLICRADRAEEIKKLHALVGEKFGAELL
jgi:mannose-1-phosphate guanylyltransferase